MGPSQHMRKSAHGSSSLPQAPSTLRRRNLKTQLHSTVKPTVHTNPETKTELFENALQTGGIWPCVLERTENILKTEFSKTMTSR